MHKPLRLASLLILLTASPAFAAEDGGLLSINTGLMIWTVLIFLIVLAVLYKFAYPHILGAVEAREARIRELLASAERDREEAQALLAQQRADLEQNRARAQELLAETRLAGERMREEMLAHARHEQEELMARARRDVALEMERAIATVRREAVEVALAAAEKLIARNLDSEENRRLVRRFMDEVDNPRIAAPAGV